MKYFLLLVSTFLYVAFNLISTPQIYAQQKQSFSRSAIVNPINPKELKPTSKVPVRQIADKLNQYPFLKKNSQKPNGSNIYQPIAPIFPHHRPDYVKDIYSDSKTGLPIFIQSDPGVLNPAHLTNDAAIRQATFQYLNELKKLMQIKSPENEFEIKSIEKDQQNYIHIKLQQIYMGTPIYGAEVNFHFEPKGSIYLNARHTATPNVEHITPAITEDEAIRSTIHDVSNKTTYRELTEAEKEILQYETPETNLVFYSPKRSSYKLAYHITMRPNFIERWEYFIDAHSGKVLNFYNHTCTVGPVTTNGTHLNGSSHTVHTFLQSDNSHILIDASKDMYVHKNNANPPNPELGHGVIVTLDMINTNPQNDDAKFEEIKSNNNTWSQLELSAHVNAGIAYDYFRNTHDWQSINGEGGDIISFINVTDEDGKGFDNAFWNGAAMFYGNGNRAFSPLAGSVDVGGHEMGHGVIQATANLEYQGESGALNESYADIFGAMIDRDDWQLGEDVVNRNFFPTGALRDMMDPHNGGNSLNDNGWQPAHTNEQYTGSQDNGGVHINSGINNRAYYLVANAIGRDKAELIFFRALRRELIRSSQFVDMRIGAEKSAEVLYGQNEINAVKSAYDQVGIQASPGGGTPLPGDIDINPGQDFIISEDINTADTNTLYISNTAATGFQILSQIPAKRPISITDNGVLGYFVGLEDHNVYETITDPAQSPFQQIFFNDLDVWDNVAVSKDGNRIATVSIAEDSAIYIWDLTGRPNIIGLKYSLYNPTTVDTAVTRNVRFADAIHWDNTGEYVMYDAFNSIKNNQGQDVEYWDVGFLKAWNNATNDFGDGTISKLFTNLPEGVSVGNATFSKNSPFIIAFDYFEDPNPNIETDDEYFILGGNIETGDIGTFFENNTFGFPSYSKLDDLLVFGSLDNTGNEEVKIIGIQADKINAASTPASLIEVAKFPVWYTVGVRDFNPTSIEEDLVEKYNLNVFPNPFSNEINVDISLTKSEKLELAIYDLLGHKVQTLHDEKLLTSGTHHLAYSINNLPAATYLLRLVIDGRATHTRIVKVGQ